jgi:DNA-binding beta-propeller fold protein YncE
MSGPLIASEPKIPLVEYKKVMELTGNSNMNIIMPTDIAIGKEQRIYIVDSGNHRIQAYKENGSFLFTFGSKGSGRDELDSPVGITASHDGKIYVADRGNQRIQIYDPDGHYLNTISTVIGKSKFVPVDVVLDQEKERMLVSATLPHHRILVFSLKGKLIEIWGKPGSNYGEFRYPAALALGHDNETYVVDVFNTRVQVLNSKGKFLVSVGSWGVTPGHLFRPKGIAIENDDQILISDSYLGVVQVFNHDTRFHAVLGERGKIARFETPAGMTVDKKDRVYIAEILANKVSVFQPMNKKM